MTCKEAICRSSVLTLLGGLGYPARRSTRFGNSDVSIEPEEIIEVSHLKEDEQGHGLRCFIKCGNGCYF